MFDAENPPDFLLAGVLQTLHYNEHYFTNCTSDLRLLSFEEVAIPSRMQMC